MPLLWQMRGIVNATADWRVCFVADDFPVNPSSMGLTSGRVDPPPTPSLVTEWQSAADHQSGLYRYLRVKSQFEQVFRLKSALFLLKIIFECLLLQFQKKTFLR